MLEVKQVAPDFSLVNQEGKEVSLSQYKGQKVVLYFYPGDHTPGCTSQACAFAGSYAGFLDLNAVVIGISGDSEKSHEQFAKDYDLPFVLLADPDHIAIELYQVWQEKIRDGIAKMGIVRTTYIIDEEGYIELVMNNVNPDTNAGDILSYFKAKHS